MTTKIALLLLAGGIAAAQSVSVGVKGGVPITDAFETFQGNSAAYASHTRRYLVGPTVQINLGRFAIEFDAIYKRLGYQYEQQQGANGPVVQHTTANSWEFPILGKFDLISGPIRPFADAGASFRNISGIKTVRNVIDETGSVLHTSFETAPEFHKDTDIGFVFGGGLEFVLGRLRVTPEFRYTRWGSENFRDPVNALLRTDRNQGDFLLGLTF